MELAVWLQREIHVHRGPLPPPEQLAEHNVVIPDGAERIMRMAEKQMAHRIGDGKPCREKPAAPRGDGTGMVIGGTSLASLVGAFVYGKKQQAASLREKRGES